MLGQDQTTSCQNFKMLWHTFSQTHKISISCFLEDIVRLRKLEKNSLKGCESFCGARLFHVDDFLGVEVFNFTKSDT